MIEKCYIIPVEKLCNANCTFCITKSRNYCKGEEFLKINNEFLKKIELLKKRGIKVFEITGGGEPTLNPNLEVIINLIRKIIPDAYIKLYTNGNILRSIGPVNEITISVAHFDDKINDAIMKPKINISLKNKLKFFKNSIPNAKTRLSIALSKEGIDNSDKLTKFINETKNEVDEYIVRTLYPGCPNYKENYVDFDYQNELVKFERDNNVDDFSGIILWSDGNIYTSWDLDKKRHLYTYLLLKPDSRIYINQIDEIINQNNFNITSRLLVKNFVGNATTLYQDKEKEYLEKVKRHLLNSAYLFGNEGLIYILDKNIRQNELAKETYDLKNTIRQNLAFTQNYGAYINFEQENYHLNLVHAPDGIIDYYNRDINLIETFSDTRIITEEDFSLIKKYRSYNL